MSVSGNKPDGRGCDRRTSPHRLRRDSRASIPPRTSRSRCQGTLTLLGGIVAATEDLTVTATSITLDGASVFIADDLVLSSTGSIDANTLANTLNVESTLQGDVRINEATTITVETATVNDGSLTIAAGEALTIDDARTIVDRAGNDIDLRSTGDLTIGYVETAVNSGAEKANGFISLDSRANVIEAAESDGSFDNLNVDVFGRTVTIYDDTLPAAPTLMNSATDVGVDRGLEVRTTLPDDGTATPGLISGLATRVSNNQVRARRCDLPDRDGPRAGRRPEHQSGERGPLRHRRRRESDLHDHGELRRVYGSGRRYGRVQHGREHARLDSRRSRACINAGQTAVTAAANEVRGSVTLVATAANTAFTVDAQVQQENDVVVTDPADDSQPPISGDYEAPIRDVGITRPQITEVLFGDVESGRSYAVVVGNTSTRRASVTTSTCDCPAWGRPLTFVSTPRRCRRFQERRTSPSTIRRAIRPPIADRSRHHRRHRRRQVHGHDRRGRVRIHGGGG